MQLVFWLVETIFSHFFSDRSQLLSVEGSLFFNWGIFFSKYFISASGNNFFAYWKQHYFIPKFLFYQWVEYYWKSGKWIFKDEPYFC